MTQDYAKRLPSIVVGMAVAATIGTATPSSADFSVKVNLYGKADNGAFLTARFMPSGTPAGVAASPVTAGKLTGTLVDPAGAAHPLDEQVTLPVHRFTGSTSNCQAPVVMLGPTDLDLLGVTMHVEQTQLPLSSGKCPTAP